MAKHEITELETGERVILERIPGVRSVVLGFWIGVGSKDAPDARTARGEGLSGGGASCAEPRRRA